MNAEKHLKEGVKMSVQLKSIGKVFSEIWELYTSRAVPILVVV
jgi:hypothetical protein